MNKTSIIESATQAISAQHIPWLEQFQWLGNSLRLTHSNGQTHTWQLIEKPLIDRTQSLRIVASNAADHCPPLAPLLVTPYLTPVLCNACKDIGLNFMDTAGNAFLSGNGFWLFISGMPRPKNLPAGLKTRDEQVALRTANGLRLVFALLTNPSLLQKSQRDMASYAGVALGSVGKVLADLQQHTHLSQAQRGKSLRLLAPDVLAKNWIQHYPVALRPKLNARRYAPIGSKHWQDITLNASDAIWAGESAAKAFGVLSSAQLGTVYTWAPREAFIIGHRLRPDPNGPLEILDAFWHPNADQMDSDSSSKAALLLAAADLTANPDGRNQEAAEQLLKGLNNV